MLLVKKIFQTRKQKIFIGGCLLLVIVLAVAVTFAIFQTESSKANLGEKLEYVGAQSQICFPSCPNFSQTYYYFVTAMNEAEIKDYFNKLKYSLRTSFEDTLYGYKTFGYAPTVSADSNAWLDLYTSESFQKEKASIAKKVRINKPRVVEMSDQSYQIFKQSFQP